MNNSILIQDKQDDPQTVKLSITEKFLLKISKLLYQVQLLLKSNQF